MTKSFIKEAYTNLCQDKDTLFYKLKNNHGHNINHIGSVSAEINKDNCKKKCKEEKCAIFTYNERVPRSSNNCTIYRETDLSSSNFKKAEVDCQKAYDKDGNFMTSSNKIPRTEIGVGYIEPSFFRENKDKFRMTSYYLDLVKQIKNDFEYLKNSTEILRTSGSENTFYKNVCPATKIPHVYNIFDASNHELTTGEKSKNGWYDIIRSSRLDSESNSYIYDYSFRNSIPFGEIQNANTEEECKQKCDSKSNCKMYIYNNIDKKCKLYTDTEMRKNLLDKMIVSCEDNINPSIYHIHNHHHNNWMNTNLNSNFNYMTPLTSYTTISEPNRPTWLASQVHSDNIETTMSEGTTPGTVDDPGAPAIIQQDLSNNRGDYNGIVKFNSSYFNNYWNGTSLFNHSHNNGTVNLKFYQPDSNTLANTGDILTTSVFGSGINHFFSDTTKQKFRSLNNNINKLSNYLNISNDMVLSRLIPDRKIVLRNDRGEILRDKNNKQITIDLTSSFLTSIAFDGMSKNEIKNAVENKKYYGVDDDGNDISGNMYDGVHDYVTNSLLKQDKEKNKLLGDLENIENNLSRSNILYLFLLFLFSLIIIVFVLYKLKFKFINDIRIIFFLAGIIAIVVLLHFLIK
jgi:hypothetical protein